MKDRVQFSRDEYLLGSYHLGFSIHFSPFCIGFIKEAVRSHIDNKDSSSLRLDKNSWKHQPWGHGILQENVILRIYLC